MTTDSSYTQAQFSDSHFRGAFKKSGMNVLKKVLLLYYAGQKPGIPSWAKAAIYGALGYFVMPADAVPDLLPGGITDDLGVIAGALVTVALYVDQSVKDQAEQKMRDWFD